MTSSMSTTTKQTLLLLQHPSHEHPLKLQDLRNDNWPLPCCLCQRKISAEAYTCQERCNIYTCYHRVCVEAPPQIDGHPLHPDHPLTLVHGLHSFNCYACDHHFYSNSNSFRCDECEFDLDLACALSTLSDEGGSRGGKTSEQITLPLHPHTLTSFSTRHDFVGDNNCYICCERVEGDGYMCLRPLCKFVIHKRCIQDLYYADGAKAPRVYHGHPLEVFEGEDTGSRTCASCVSNKSGELIGCATCQEFYHRNCFQVPEILQYPSHNPDHTLVLFPKIGNRRQCQSCSNSLEDEIYYSCTSCEFFVHIRCAFSVVTYCAEGMSAKIELPWHKHLLLLCHLTEPSSNGCAYCGDESIGGTYVCEDDCGFLLHKQCTEMESTITTPHHPDHLLTLCVRDGNDYHVHLCKACGYPTRGAMFSCQRCLVDFHLECAARLPTRKHYLHEHKLLHFDRYMDFGCDRCKKSTHSPIFRCIPCGFNLHEECMEFPQVVESKIHWHPLTLHETFVEDDSGEYYCEHCEETRDPRLGVYVCGECKLSMPRIYHIECVLPELGKVYEKSLLPPAVEKLIKQIADKREEVFTIKEKVRTMKEKVRTKEEKLEGATRELVELVKQRDILLKGESDDES